MLGWGCVVLVSPGRSKSRRWFLFLFNNHEVTTCCFTAIIEYLVRCGKMSTHALVPRSPSMCECQEARCTCGVAYTTYSLFLCPGTFNLLLCHFSFQFSISKLHFFLERLYAAQHYALLYFLADESSQPCTVLLVDC